MQRQSLIALLTLSMLAIAIPDASAQGPVMKQQRPQMERAPGTAPALKIEAPPIKVEAAGVTVTPEQPRVGQTATVRVTIKNAGIGTVRVPWTLRNATEDTLLGQGTVGRVEPGQSAERPVEFRPGRAGAVKLRLRVDLQNNTATATTKELDVTVLPQASAQQEGTPVEMETRLLEHVKAKNAGANFSGNRDLPCQLRNHGGYVQAGISAPDSVRLHLDCSGLVGDRRDLESYSNFRLKNGWKVVRVDVTEDGNSRGGRGWSWRSPAPAAGSDNPYFNIHLWAEANSLIMLHVKITIRGPKTADPYQ